MVSSAKWHLVAPRTRHRSLTMMEPPKQQARERMMPQQQLHLASIKEMNQLAASVAEVTADQENAAAERKAALAAKSKDREKKKTEEAAAEAKKKEELMPALEALMARFDCEELTAPAGFHGLPKSQLVNIIKYFYESRPKGLATMGKKELVKLVMQHYDPSYSEND